VNSLKNTLSTTKNKEHYDTANS